MDGGFPVSGFCMERDSDSYYYGDECDPDGNLYGMEWDPDNYFYRAEWYNGSINRNLQN